MALNDDLNDLNLSIKLKVDGFDYVVFVSSDTTMKCFGCGMHGHLVRDCPNERGEKTERTVGGSAAPASDPPASISDTTAADLITESPLAASPEPSPEPTPAVAPAQPITGAVGAEGVGPKDPALMEQKETGCKVGELLCLTETDTKNIDLSDEFTDAVSEMDTDASIKTTKRKSRDTTDSSPKAKKEETHTEKPKSTDAHASDQSQLKDPQRVEFVAEVNNLTGAKTPIKVTVKNSVPETSVYLKRVNLRGSNWS